MFCLVKVLVVGCRICFCIWFMIVGGVMGVGQQVFMLLVLSFWFFFLMCLWFWVGSRGIIVLLLQRVSMDIFFFGKNFFIIIFLKFWLNNLAIVVVVLVEVWAIIIFLLVVKLLVFIIMGVFIFVVQVWVGVGLVKVFLKVVGIFVLINNCLV